MDLKGNKIYIIISGITLLLLIIVLVRSKETLDFYGRCNCECSSGPPQIVYVNNTIRETITDIKEPDIICKMPACKFSGYNKLNNSRIKGAVVGCSDGLNRYRYCNGTIKMDRIY